MRYLIGASAAALLLAGCGGPDTEGTIATEDGEFDYSIDTTGGNSEFSGQTADGREVSIQSGSNVTADLPEGFSVYPGSTVVSSSNVSAGDGSGSIVFMTTPDTPEQVAEFYRGQAEAAGITIQIENTSQSGRMLSGEGDGGKSFTLSAGAGDAGTSVQLLVGADFAE